MEFSGIGRFFTKRFSDFVVADFMKIATFCKIDVSFIGRTVFGIYRCFFTMLEASGDAPVQYLFTSDYPSRLIRIEIRSFLDNPPRRGLGGFWATLGDIWESFGGLLTGSPGLL